MLVPETMETDLLIIGAGMAGMAAAVFAANRGIKTVLAGGAGTFESASGLLDLWGVPVPDSGSCCTRPWAALADLSATRPEHPMGHIPPGKIEQAFDEVTAALKKQGLEYTGTPRSNHMVLTPFGTLKPTFRMPVSMMDNARAVKAKPPCLILGFKGLREFSAAFVHAMQHNRWPKLRHEQILFPSTGEQPDLLAPALAQLMESQTVQDELVGTIRRVLKTETHLGLPAVLGYQSTSRIKKRLETRLGVKVFEIPTTPMSVAGIRLKQAFYSSLSQSPVTVLGNQLITRAQHDGRQGFLLEIQTDMNRGVIHTGSVVLAAGRFLGGGLEADIHNIHEPLFNLDVCQPENREDWHAADFFDPAGHGINLAGIAVDKDFRPVDRKGNIVHQRLFAAGSILAGQDWMRTRSGAGFSIATAFMAVEGALQEI